MSSLWKFDQFSKLNRLISDSFETSDEEAGFFAKELNVALEGSSSHLALLFDFPKPNASHLEKLEKGAPIINEKEFKVNPEFISEAKKVSSFLEIDEYFAAALVREGMEYEKRLERPIAECAILLFYSERQKLLLTLDSIFSGGINNNAPELVKNTLQTFANKLLSSIVLISTDQKSAVQFNQNTSEAEDMFPTRALRTIGSNKSFIEKLKTKASSVSFPFGAEIVSEVSISLNEERRLLASIYYTISSDYQLNSSELMSLITHLQGLDPTDELTLKLVPSILAVLDSSVLVNLDPEYVEADAIDKTSLLATDPEFLRKLDAEITSKTWKEPGLKGLVQLQWALSTLFGIKRVSGFAEAIGYQEERAEQLIEEAATSSCFNFSSNYLLAYRQPELYPDNNKQNPSENSFSTTLETNSSQPLASSGEKKTGEPASYPKFVDLDETIAKVLEYRLENMVTNYITRSTPIIRRIRYNEEDQINKYHQQKILEQQTEQYQAFQGIYGSNRFQNLNSGDTDKTALVEPIRHTESLFNLIAVLYKGRMEAGLRFWVPGITGISEVDERLLTFIRWGMDMREQGMILSFLKMIAALSSGPQSALCAHEFMVTAGGKLLEGSRSSFRVPFCSWDSLFGALDFYQQKLQQYRTDAVSVAPEIPESEVSVINTFLDVLKNVVLYSITARVEFYQNSELQVMWILFSLLGCSVPVTVKAKIFEVLAAFCSPIPGSTITENSEFLQETQTIHSICMNVWQLLEQSQALQTMPENILSGNTQMGWYSRGGIAYELEEIETALGNFGETRGFLSLIDALIHLDVDAVPLNNLERSPVIFSDNSPTIPSDLGKEYRIPGINPYISYILDNVFGKSNQRVYKNEWEKWFVVCKSLQVIEKCLATMVLPQASGVFGLNSYRLLITHPGFEVCLRILCGAELLQSIFTVLKTGVDLLNSAEGTRGNLMVESTLSAMRIIYKILCVQNVILNVVIPELLESNSQELFDLPLSLPRGLTSIDNLLLLQPDIVVLIASYINTIKSSALCDASVKIVYTLSHSSYFNAAVDELKTASSGFRIYSVNRLVQILSESQESNRIIHGYISRLEQDDSDFTEGIVDDSIDTSTEILGQEAAYGHANGISDKLTQNSFSAVSLSIVELLISNIESNKSVPNIAHWLLGFSLQNTPKDDLPNPSTRLTCLHSILLLLNQGTSVNPEETRPSDQLIHLRPRLAQACYRLIYILATNTITSKVFLRYIDKNEDFVSVQLQSLLPTSVKGVSSEIRSGLIDLIKSPAIENTIISLPELHPARIFSQLMSYSWLLQYSAHELHLASLSGKLSRVNRIVDVLTQSTSALSGQPSQYSLADPFYRKSGLSVCPNIFLNIFKNMRDVYSDCLLTLSVRKKLVFGMFESEDARYNLELNELNNIALQLGVELENTTTQSNSGCLIYDLHTISGLVRNPANIDPEATKNQSFTHNARLLLVSCFFINLERELFFSYAQARLAWRQVAQIIATSSWRYISEPKGSQMGLSRKAQLCNDMLAAISSDISGLPPPYPITFSRSSDDLLASELSSILSTSDELRSIELSTMLSSIFVFFSKRLAQELSNEDSLGHSIADSSTKSSNLYLEPTVQTWKNIVLSALSSNAKSSMEIRTNIYSCMIHFLSGIRGFNSDASPEVTSRDNFLGSSNQHINDQTTTPSHRSSANRVSTTPFTGGQGFGTVGNLESQTKKQKLVQRVLEELTSTSVGEQLLECVSIDSLDGTDACRAVSFSLLNAVSALYSIEPRNRLIPFLSRHNYIAQFVDVLRREDSKLASLLTASPESMNSLFIYESIMSFFLRFAYRRIGTERLIEGGIIDALSNSSFINLRPQVNSYTRDAQPDDSFAGRMERYNQMLIPVLNLLAVLLTKVGKENLQVYERVYKFVSLHYLPFQQILKEALAPNSVLTKQSLNEVKSISLVLCLLTKLRPIVEKSFHDAKAGVLGIFNLYSPALCLLSRFSADDSWLPYTQPLNEDDALLSNTPSLLLMSLNSANSPSRNQEPAQLTNGVSLNSSNVQAFDPKFSLLAQQSSFIVRNIIINVLMMSYAISKPQSANENDPDAPMPRPLNPTLGWQIDNNRDSDQFPSVGTVIIQLRQILSSLSKYQNLLSFSIEKLSTISSLSTQELKKLAASTIPSSLDFPSFNRDIQSQDPNSRSFLSYPELPKDLSMQQLQSLAATALNRNKKEAELQISLFMVSLEQALLLLFVHIDFYYQFDQVMDGSYTNGLGQSEPSKSYFTSPEHNQFGDQLNAISNNIIPPTFTYISGQDLNIFRSDVQILLPSLLNQLDSISICAKQDKEPSLPNGVSATPGSRRPRPQKTDSSGQIDFVKMLVRRIKALILSDEQVF